MTVTTKQVEWLRVLRDLESDFSTQLRELLDTLRGANPAHVNRARAHIAMTTGRVVSLAATVEMLRVKLHSALTDVVDRCDKCRQLLEDCSCGLCEDCKVPFQTVEHGVMKCPICGEHE